MAGRAPDKLGACKLPRRTGHVLLPPMVRYARGAKPEMLYIAVFAGEFAKPASVISVRDETETATTLVATLHLNLLRP
jgi:hypothetical protein